ncbi:MAG: tRNA (N6-threonylcarbamoyladenosine(37)-N6)-methyltransferase TrmO [Lachnospiraceae bacterium]
MTGSNEHQLKVIAHIETDFSGKFGIPRQSGISWELEGRIVFEEEFRNPEAVRGLEDFSHIWLLWQFSENIRDGWSPTVRPPKLGGNTRMGVFATRSPYRPNPIGLSCVMLTAVQLTEEFGPVLYVRGADLMNGTPIYDIKPYLPYTDSQPGASGGFTDDLMIRPLEVYIPEKLRNKVAAEKLKPLTVVLSQDPRPAYHHDPERIYGFEFAGMEVKFVVQGALLKVTDIQFLQNK